MNFNSAELHLYGAVFEDTLICLPQPFGNTCDHLSFNVARLYVIDITYKGKLFPVDGIIRDAGVIRVKLEPNRH